VSLGSEVEEFLAALKPGTRKVYGRGLALFAEFLKEQKMGGISDFLNEVELDLQRPRLQKRHVARKALNSFIEFLQARGYPPNSVNAFVGSVQALGKYFDIPIGGKYVKRPPTQAVNKKHPWTIEEIGDFVLMMDDIQLQCIAACIVQSGLSLSDLLRLTYGDIRSEYERGITPLCLDMVRKKTGVPFLTFFGTWAVDMMRKNLEGRRLTDKTPLFTKNAASVEKRFRTLGQRFAGERFKGRNPFSPHTLRAAFRTILSDHQIDHIIIEFWMGHAVPEQQIVYVSKSREGWRETYRTLAEPWLTPPQFKAQSPSHLID
jgi:integrase